MGPWHSGRISIQHWRHKNSVRSEGDPKGLGWFFQLEAGQDCVTYRSAIGYRIVHCVLRHGYVAVTPSFQLLICGTLDLNILPYTLAAITFKRGPLHQTAAMATGILTTQKQGKIAEHKSTLTYFSMNVCVPRHSWAPPYCIPEICPSLLPSTHLCYIVILNTFIIALAYSLILMRCILELIFPEWQITSASYLRSFAASASSFLTALFNLISANPDVLGRKTQGSAE